MVSGRQHHGGEAGGASARRLFLDTSEYVAQLERAALELACELREAQVELAQLEEQRACVEATTEEEAKRTQEMEVRAIETQQGLESEKQKLALEDQKAQAYHQQLKLLQRNLTEVHIAKGAEEARLNGELKCFRKQSTDLESRRAEWVKTIATTADALSEDFAATSGSGGGAVATGAVVTRESSPAPVTPRVTEAYNRILERLRALSATIDEFGLFRAYIRGQKDSPLFAPFADITHNVLASGRSTKLT